jgi:opacity protein-like surface antigen
MYRLFILSAVTTLCVVGTPMYAGAQDFERPGLYIGGGWSRLGEQFGDDLNDEIESALEFDDADLSASDTDIYAGVIGVRVNSRLAFELVGEYYEDIPIDLSEAGIVQSGDVELMSGMLMGKLYLLTGRLQPYLMAGAGYLRAEIDFGDVDETADAPLGRAGVGIETYLTPNLALAVQAAYSRSLDSDLDELAFFNVGGSLMIRF